MALHLLRPGIPPPKRHSHLSSTYESTRLSHPTKRSLLATPMLFIDDRIFRAVNAECIQREGDPCAVNVQNAPLAGKLTSSRVKSKRRPKILSSTLSFRIHTQISNRDDANAFLIYTMEALRNSPSTHCAWIDKESTELKLRMGGRIFQPTRQDRLTMSIVRSMATEDSLKSGDFLEKVTITAFGTQSPTKPLATHDV
ncbi:hypothetical protein HDK90DRAFT_205831 [Phyllosticta capitalensis]|uniref:Uncharacterized protein n=1 Tax=Phyllosticta capitalensis TaxID=121624 RepID=A0ABR1YSU8_9PEZI